MRVGAFSFLRDSNLGVEEPALTAVPPASLLPLRFLSLQIPVVQHTDTSTSRSSAASMLCTEGYMKRYHMVSSKHSSLEASSETELSSSTFPTHPSSPLSPPRTPIFSPQDCRLFARCGQSFSKARAFYIPFVPYCLALPSSCTVSFFLLKDWPHIHAHGGRLPRSLSSYMSVARYPS